MLKRSSGWQPVTFRGVYLLDPFFHQDERGSFVKTYYVPECEASGLSFELREEFYSISQRDVIRGMHFQIPPHQHQKIVYCSSGRILDVLVDLRTKEPTYGQATSFELSSLNRHSLWIPPGIAHGFCALEDGTCVVYKTDCEYAPESDAGIRWDSIDYDWQIDRPKLSDRDAAFPALSEFQSPF
ncbi:MAG: dTDP-4-dehydrorhamnose 3,5-epimerase family protein [bacterium]|nr:dTDP-4-dehydrorhamnose 3,5-epimerase family protein [bacterium]